MTNNSIWIISYSGDITLIVFAMHSLIKAVCGVSSIH